MSSEITLYKQIQDPVGAIDKMGEWFSRSGMVGADNINAGKVLAWECFATGRSPNDIMRRFDIIGGKLRTKALASYADFRAKGGKVKWLATGEDGKRAEAEFTFEGQAIKVAFTLEQAIQGGAIIKPGSNWVKTPGNMLRARCLSNAIAMLCPEIFAGSDDDGEQDAAPAPSISLGEPISKPATVAATVSTSPVSPAREAAIAAVNAQDKVPMDYPVKPTIIDAQVISESSPVVPTTPPPMNVSQPAPAATVTPTVEKPVAATPVGSSAAASLLSDETVARLEAAISEHAINASKWLLGKGWLKPGETLASLTQNRANQILNNTAKFIGVVNGGAA